MMQTQTNCFTVDFWQNEPDPDSVELTCLMPSGMVITFTTFANATIREIKEDIWCVAQKCPLTHLAKEKSMYVITAITTFATIDELTNESKRLCDVQPYFCLLKIVEKPISSEISTEIEITQDIGNLIGKSVEEFRALKNLEINDFRYKMSLLADEIAFERSRMSWMDRLLYQYPPRLAKSSELPDTISGRLRNDNFVIVFKLENDEYSFTVYVPYHMTPLQFLDMTLTKLARANIRRGERASDLILKVCGRDEYLYGNYPLVQFTYIQDTLSRDGVPTVTMKLLQHLDIFSEMSESRYYNQTHCSADFKSISTCTLRKKAKHVSSWSIEEPFQIKLHSIENINCDINKNVEVAVYLGLFHGGKSLCAYNHSKDVLISTNNNVDFDDDILTFDITVKNVPRMARLCIVIYEITKSTKVGSMRAKRIKDNKQLYMNPLAWVNTTIFDYKDQLKTGVQTLYSWTYAEDIQSENMFHSLGTIESNPRTEDCAAVKLTFHNYDYDSPILFPTEDTILAHAEWVANTKSLNRDSAQDTRTIIEILSPYLSNDRYYEMHDQERNAIWSKRIDCQRDAPEGLPLLLHCVEWNNRDEVSEVNKIMKSWPQLSVERSLELLDYAYADPVVRAFSVNCLKLLKDEELLLYLLQLVQAIKHESYLDCDLVVFLLDRALHNQRIGHYFFWHLRSEMQVPAVQNRFGLILEAYLKGSTSHVPLLIKQIKCLEKLKQMSEMAKKGSKEKVRAKLQDSLMKENSSDVFRNVMSPLDPSFRYKLVRHEKCKVMDSKMRPLWIDFENSDMHGEDIFVIFKNGDDLRQDMLTLQMLRVMDQIWKNHGYDFRMNIYGCISMERRLGMIEVVLNAETIANIQKEKGMFSATSPFRKGSLLSWLKDYNSSEEALQKAINEFTLSCAGYCVATYVLGVADRHSDNIMVKKTGQLFHIDFGHILGHFKEKFGVRRERVPFVLTHDFVYVINNGRTDKEADEFRYFQNLCEKAFLILRQHGCLILSLFAMMISTGLPELSSEKDLNYLKETLVLDVSEEKAREHFKSKFSEALANSWKTSLNWASHNFSKNTKQ